MTDIERLMNVSTDFSDNGNNSSWIIILCVLLFVYLSFFRFSSFFYLIWTSVV